MLHYSTAKKNKHQQDQETIPEIYLYKDHKVAKKLLKNISLETEAELHDDIFYMRRHFKHTVKRLRRSIYYSNWLKNIPERDILHQQMRLRSRHA